ncbi:MAG: hypothetical protein AAF558_09010 [Verrucomicrobiota bacterium]
MIDHQGITSSSGVTLSWSELTSITVYKIDAKIKVLTYLTFHHDSGDFLEFTNEDAEYQVIFNHLDSFIDLADSWRNRIESLKPEEPLIQLWPLQTTSH